MVHPEVQMNRSLCSFSLALLFALAACAGDDPSPSQGGGGTGGSGAAFPAAGPASVVREETDAFVYFFPDDLDAETVWPALVWFNGASGYQDDFNYNGLLESVASWGFIVIGGKSPGMNPEESDERGELLRRNEDAADLLFGKVDLARIALAGHSLGGFQTTESSSQYRVAVAIQGAGTPTGSETAPTLFMTSEGDEVVPASIVITAFERAIDEAWLAVHASADHNDPRTDGGVYREPLTAFLRWKLYDDDNGASWFVGNACLLCTDADWGYETK
jgi:dienelactone hydrolase